jgi:hypothetical protein
MTAQYHLDGFKPDTEKWYADMRDRFASANLSRKQRYLLVAIMFAGHSANAQVAQAERDIAAWHVDGFAADFVPSYGQARWAKMYDSAVSFTESRDIAWFALDKWQMVNDLAMQVHGLGAVKASFALALCGYDIACLDRHVLQNAGYTTSEIDVINRITAPKRYDGAIDNYRFIHDSIYPVEPRLSQWNDFAISQPTFAMSGHRPYFLAQGVRVGA